MQVKEGLPTQLKGVDFMQMNFVTVGSAFSSTLETIFQIYSSQKQDFGSCNLVL